MKIAVVNSILILVIAAVAVPTNADSSLLTPQGDPDRYIVVYNKDRGVVEQNDFVAGQVHFSLPALNAIAVSISPDALEGLRNNPGIELIVPDVLRYPMGSFRGASSSNPKTNHDATTTRSLAGQETPYGIHLVQADQVPMGSSFVPKICIIDSGFNLGHEDLPGGSQVTGDSDIEGAGEWFEDGSSHGTHVAGTIAAVDNDIGVVGVCPGCNLHIVRVFGENGDFAYSSSLVAAAMKCRDAGANIISMSLGGNSKSRFEDKAFKSLLTDHNILSVAAAGNDGNTELSYPASYDSVMSVAAIDDKRAIADISQQNSQVEISAPGVGVDSSVKMGSGFEASITTLNPNPLTAGRSTSYEATNMEGSELNELEAELFDCGLGDAVCTGAAGMICLMQRGEIPFADKVANCHSGGGVGAIVYNNEPGTFSGTLGEGWTIKTTAYAVTDETGSELLGLAGTGAKVSFTGTISNYGAKDGTSMATPHVSGVAGLVWSYDATKSAQDIRDALTTSALDLGTAGRDNAYGFGLVQACNAAEALGATGLSCSEPSDLRLRQ